MLKFLQEKFLLSKQGAKNTLKATLLSTLLYFVRFSPYGVATFFIMESIEIYLLKTLDRYSFALYIVLVVVVCVLQYFIHRLQYNLSYFNTYKESTRIRVETAERIRKLPLSFFEKRDISDLTATILGDVTIIEETYSHSIPQFLGSFVLVSVVFMGYFIFSPVLAVAMYWPVVVVALIIIFVKNNLSKNELKHSNQKRVVADKIQEVLENILEIKAYKAKDKIKENFKKELDKEFKAHIKSEASMAAIMAPLNGILTLGSLTSVYVLIKAYQDGNLGLSFFVSLMIIAFIIYEPIRAVIPSIMQLIMMEIPVKRMKKINLMPIMDGKEIKIEKFDIEFKNVSFAYENEEYVLNDINLTINQGEVTAFVGPSGSGKSSLAKLAIRFWDPQKGEINLGGQDISKIEPEHLYKYYSMVFQNVVLFNNSVLENVRIGNPKATDDEVIEACKIAMADEFISLLPNGYETMIGEDGRLLSGGERQRISIARAVLKNSPIIILDEASASMDAQNESLFQEALSKLIKNKTVIIIAHRLRTVADADKIVVLDKGQVVEEGSFDTLMRQKGLFYRLWSKQKG
ncbi:MAG: ABC transporter ATP-binding protein [Campylobacteraceae bacterium]|mgnify:CR=1 FL=1|nr:ABC transporter ATP-binding protein [Campylobacteraceae bacterium]